MFQRMGDFVSSVRSAAASLNLDRLRDTEPATSYEQLNLTVVAPRLVGEGAGSAEPACTPRSSRGPRV